MYRNWILFLVAFWAFLFFAIGSYVDASPLCGDRKEYIDMLAYRYGEVLVAQLLSPDGGPTLELLMNGETGSWTIMSTDQNATTCLIAAGTDGRPKPDLPGRGA